jgi:cyclic pyranopterin phosphate synthase
MPAEGVQLRPHDEILTIEEYSRLIRVAAGLGIKRVRLSGGEPLVRLGVVDLVRHAAAARGIEDISMTTNGLLLARYAQDLRQAGLSRVNISLDTLKAERFKEITRLGDIQDVFKGIDAALAAGLEPVKINVVVMRGINDDEITALADLSRGRPLHVRFIELMPVGESLEASAELYVPAAEILERLGSPPEDQGPVGYGPSRNYRLPGAKGTVGVITAVSEHFCGTCNRLRVTADGKIRPCLLSAYEIDIRHILRTGNDEDVARVLEAAVRQKPEEQPRLKSGKRRMAEIGG